VQASGPGQRSLDRVRSLVPPDPGENGPAVRPGGSIDGTANREAGFPGDLFEFSVSPDAGCADSDIQWSGGGSPPTGTGRRFKTTFSSGGTFTVTARCGTETREFTVSICPVDEWLVDARGFYGPSIDWSKVHVKTSRMVFGPTGTGWTCNDVIRFKHPRQPSDFPDESTLIHELGHVWEHQSGQAQLLGGLVEQTSRLFGRDPYDFGGPEGAQKGVELSRFKKEGQAEIIRDYWLSEHGYTSDMKGVSFSTPGYVDDLRRLVEGAGIGQTAPTRRTSIGAAFDSFTARIVNAILR
jgi:hypothetical protein